MNTYRQPIHELSIAGPRDLTVVSPRLLGVREVGIAEPGRAPARDAVVESLAMSLGFDLDKGACMRRPLNEYPDLLTVEEATDYLRIGPALGYQLARQDRITDGAAGLPIVQLGRCIGVPKDKLALLVRGRLPRTGYVGSSPL